MVYKKSFILFVFVIILFPAAFCANAGSMGQSYLNVDEDTTVVDKHESEYPAYLRIDFGSQLRSADIESGIQPGTFEFHVLNREKVGWRLYENSGDYRNPHNQSDMFGACGGRVYNKYGNTGDYKRDTIGNVLSFLGMNSSAQYGETTNYAFYVDTAYVNNRGTSWIKPQYMLAVDAYIPDECGDCNPETGENEGANGKYVIARYLYNTAMYAKAVSDSVQTVNGDWVYTDKYYDKNKNGGIEVSESDTESGYLYNSKNFNKVQPVKDKEARNPNGAAYKYDGEWVRLAFAWAIHKGDSLYVLKGVDLEPMYKGAADDPHQVWLTLSREYGKEGKYVDFDQLLSENIVPGSAYKEAYYPLGDRSPYPEMRTYHDFKPATALSPGKTIGLHAVVALDDNTHKDWVFSFRLVQRWSDDFVIESEVADRNTAEGAMIRPGYAGWLKIQNGVPVITQSDEKDIMGEAGGSIFNIKQVSNPVSNKEVNTMAATKVTVIGGAGNVKILNAAGKKVVISDILGRVVANKAISSDNESIAVPSGIVIVAVEGEKAFKVVVLR